MNPMVDFGMSGTQNITIPNLVPNNMVPPGYVGPGQNGGNTSNMNMSIQNLNQNMNQPTYLSNASAVPQTKDPAELQKILEDQKLNTNPAVHWPSRLPGSPPEFRSVDSWADTQHRVRGVIKSFCHNPNGHDWGFIATDQFPREAGDVQLRATCLKNADRDCPLLAQVGLERPSDFRMNLFRFFFYKFF